MKNPFESLSKKEIKQREEKAVKAKQHIKEAQALASRCFENEDFVLYREKLMKAQETLIEHLILYSEPDPFKYALCVSNELTVLSTLKKLLISVETDVKRKTS